MIKKQNIFYGYRGTNKKWGKKCELSDIYWKSQGKDEYFGHGIYFFENDEIEALNYAKYVKKYKNRDIAVIYTCIETTKVLDFIDTNTYKDYIKLIQTISKRYEKEAQIPNIIKPFDCKIINSICETKGILLVKGAYYPNNKLGMELYENGDTRIVKTHIQLCVRDKSIIKEKEVKYY